MPDVAWGPSRMPKVSGKAQKVLEEALSLAPEERADVAARLLESLDEQEDVDVEESPGTWSAAPGPESSSTQNSSVP